MKILVGVKRVVEHTVKIRLKADGTGVDTQHAQMAMNPFDEVALEEAVCLHESGKADEVIAISIGPYSCLETLRQALAQGAHRAVHVHTEQELSPLTVARIFKKIVDREQPQVVILGKQGIDGDNQQVGQMLAGLLGWPQATYVSDIQVEDEYWQVRRELDNSVEVVNITLPAVITVELQLNKPRYMNILNIVKSKNKIIEKLTLDELAVKANASVSVLETFLPAEKKAGMLVPDISTLIDKLKYEAKVI